MYTRPTAVSSTELLSSSTYSLAFNRSSGHIKRGATLGGKLPVDVTAFTTLISFELTSPDPSSTTADILVVIVTFVGRFVVVVIVDDDDDNIGDTMVSSG